TDSAGTIALPNAFVPAFGAGRRTLRGDSARDARPRRLDRAPTSGRTVPGQTAVALLACGVELQVVWGERGSSAFRARIGRAWLCIIDVWTGPANCRRPASIAGGAVAGLNAWHDWHGPPFDP